MENGLRDVVVSKGTLIIEEDSHDTEAYLIISGRFEVFQGSSGKRVVLSQLGPGQVFGEMALILEKPRTASVVALVDSVVRCLDSDAFVRLVNGNPHGIEPFMKVMFERLRTMSFPEPAASAAQAKRSGPLKVLVRAATPEAQAGLSGDHALAAFPYNIGRSVGAEYAIMTPNDLFIEDEEPFRVSRNHCAIDCIPGQAPFVRDRGSRLGTVVNGKALGGTLAVDTAPLKPGTNELILGPEDSPYRFEILVSR